MISYKILVWNLTSLSIYKILEISHLETELESSGLGHGNTEIKWISQKKASPLPPRELTASALMEVSESIKVHLFTWFIDSKKTQRIFKVEGLCRMLERMFKSVCFVSEEVRKNNKKIFKWINCNKVLRDTVVDNLKYEGDFDRRL